MATRAHVRQINALDEDDLVILVHTILIDPIRVQPIPPNQRSAPPITNETPKKNSHPQIPTPLPNPLLRRTLQPPLELQVIHTLPDRLAERRTLWHRLLPVPPPHSDPVDQVPLLGLVA